MGKKIQVAEIVLEKNILRTAVEMLERIKDNTIVRITGDTIEITLDVDVITDDEALEIIRHVRETLSIIKDGSKKGGS